MPTLILLTKDPPILVESKITDMTPDELNQILPSPLQRQKLLRIEKYKLGEIINSISLRESLLNYVRQQNDPQEANEIIGFIIQIIEKSGLMWGGGKMISSDIYEEALSRNKEWFLRNFAQKYNPQLSSISTWFNKYLRWKILDVSREITKQQEREDHDDTQIDNIPSPDQFSFNETIEEWRELVKNSPNLCQCRMQNYHHVDCKLLLIDILDILHDNNHYADQRNPYLWEILAKKYKVPSSSLKRFCKSRCFRGFKGLID